MKKKILFAMTLMLSTVFAFGQQTTNVKNLFRSANTALVNKIILDSLHGSLAMKVIYNGMIVQEGTELSKEYYETEPIYGNEIKSWSITKKTDSDVFVKDDSILTAYGNDGRQTSQTRFSWDETNKIWELQPDEYYTYSGDTMITSSTEGIDQKEIYYYKNGQKDSTVLFDKDNGVLRMSSSEKFKYDAENRPILMLGYTYDTISNAFVLNMKQDITYGVDKDGKNYGISRYSSWNGTMWTDTIEETNYRIVQVIEGTFYYTTKQVKPIAEDKLTNNNSISIYPNPATDGIYIKSKETGKITIYDLNGNKIVSKTVNNADYIPLNSLSKGVYLIEISDSKGTNSQKLIKK